MTTPTTSRHVPLLAWSKSNQPAAPVKTETIRVGRYKTRTWPMVQHKSTGTVQQRIGEVSARVFRRPSVTS